MFYKVIININCLWYRKDYNFTFIYRLSRFLYPTDQQLRSLAGVPKEKPRKGKHAENGRGVDTFHVPRNLEVVLESAEITELDVVHLKFYTEYQWLLDFSIYAGIVYILTEVSKKMHCRWTNKPMMEHSLWKWTK